MSVCSSTIRALSRTRISQSKTLLPFLYQTATIQQWRSLPRRNITSRSNDGDDIPFEDGTLPPAIDKPEPARKTTITGSERAAFEKLYKTFNAQGRPKNEKDHVIELDQIADEYYEDDEENQSQSLDKVFDEVLKGEPRLRASRNVHSRPKLEQKNLGQNVQASAEDTSSARTRKSQNKKDAKAEAATIKKLKLAERERIDKLLQNAQTDRDLWQILNREVFDQVRRLDLDGTKSGKEPQSSKATTSTRKPKRDPTASDPRILFQNYPHHLITAIQTLRTTFPSSSLPHSILPTIKSLGRSSYALGATTALYKHLIRTAWVQQSSYTYIDTLLVDMNNGAIEFDSEILALLDSIIKEHEMARSNRLGEEMRLVYGMEQFLNGLRAIRQWRIVIAARLGVVPEERKVQIRKLVGKVDPLPRGRVSQKPRGSSVDKGRLGGNASQEYIPLVEGTNDASAGAPKLHPEPANAKGMSDAELFVRDMGLEHAQEGSSSGVAEKTRSGTVGTDTPAKIIL
ncbi:Nn.00g109690.m01.CDS01 [Neocucurbitaria sp. VM-36]